MFDLDEDAAIRAELAPAALMSALKAVQGAHIARARIDPSAFNTYVLRDEERARPILQSPLHVEWHRLISAHRRLLLWAHVEAGKSTQMMGRVLFELGRNPNLRVLIVSNTDSQAQKLCMTIGKYIEGSAELHHVFPELVRAKGMAWNMHNLFIKRTSKAKDASIQTCGIHGNVLGSRVDLLIMDDLLDYENTISPTQREELWNWYHATLEGRLTRHAKVLCIGTAWHRDDVMHRFSMKPEWMAVRYPVLDADMNATWPERWPVDRIEEKRLVLGPLEFSRQLMCVARSDEDARFKRQWVDACIARGEGRSLTYALDHVPAGYAVYTGVDLGVRVQQGSDLSCLFTICVHPDGSREILDVQAGRWGGPDIVDKIIDVHQRYQSIVIVENNAAQEFIVQFTKKLSAVPVHSFTTTGTSLRHPEFGLETLATEMANEKWIIPSSKGRCNSEIEAWIGEALYYDPRGHPGDRLMASWFATQGVRISQRRPVASRRVVDVISR